MSDSVWPHRWKATRLPHPWGSPGKTPGVGCYFLLQGMKMKRESEVAQSYPTLSDPMDCSPPASSVHGIFQAVVLKWGAIAFSGSVYELEAISGEVLHWKPLWWGCWNWETQCSLLLHATQESSSSFLMMLRSSKVSRWISLQYSEESFKLLFSHCIPTWVNLCYTAMQAAASWIHVYPFSLFPVFIWPFSVWLHFHFSLSCIGEGNGNPLQCSCLENPKDGGTGGLPSMGLRRVGHDWSDLAAAAAAAAVQSALRSSSGRTALFVGVVSVCPGEKVSSRSSFTTILDHSFYKVLEDKLSMYFLFLRRQIINVLIKNV